MLTILNDPAGITGSERVELDFGATLQQNIQRRLAGGGDCLLLINGQPVDPTTDARLDLPPGRHDIVTVVRRPAGFDPITVLAIASLIISVASIAMLPKPGSDPAINDSPNNRLTGQSNIARAYQGIPDVYGYRRVWPDLIQQSTVEYVDHVKRVTEWLCVSRGVGDITEVKFAETPIEQIAGSTFTVFSPALTPSAYPELNATEIDNVVETFASPEVNGQEITDAIPPEEVPIAGDVVLTSNNTTAWSLEFDDSAALADLKALAPAGVAQVMLQYLWSRESGESYATDYVYFNAACTVSSFVVAGARVTFNFVGPVVFHEGTQTLVEGRFARIIADTVATQTAGPFTLPAEGNRIRWNTVFLRGLKGSVQIEAEWWKINGAGVEIGGTRQTQTHTYTDDTFDQRFYSREVTPSGGMGRYRVQFRRLTADLANGADVAKLEGLFAAVHYPLKSLPGVTIIRVTTTATAQATGFQDRRFNLRWQRKVRSLGSPALSPSRNFARAMAHLWCVAGESIAELDTTTLVAINASLGEASPLLRFDGTLDDADMSLGERLQRIAYHARCALWRDGTLWTVTRDEARASPEIQLDYRNLAAGGDSAITYAAHLPASSDGVEVEYTDEATQATRAYVRLSIASGAVVSGVPLNATRIRLPGCATTAQATNRAHLEARRLLYQRTSVQDTALQDGGQIGLGSLVRWVDPEDFAGDDGLQAGEVMSIAGALITTSEPLDWRGETSGRIMFTGVDGAPLGPPVTCAPHASGGVTLGSVPAGLFVRDDARQCGSRYAFAVGLTESETQAAGLYVATRVAPNGDGTVSIALAAYDARMFAAD